MAARLIEPRQLLRAVILPALASASAAVDDPRLADPRAAVLLAAIAVQESDLRWVRQMPTGKARSWWQIELETAYDVRVRTRDRFGERGKELLHWHGLDGPLDETLVAYPVSACVLARLNLFLQPQRLPDIGDELGALEVYKAAWRPGWAIGWRPIGDELARWSRGYVEVMAAQEGLI